MSTPPTNPAPAVIGVGTIHRGQLVAIAIIGLVLGVIGLFLPTVALVAIAILFGIYLIASGIFRINTALLVPGLSAGVRWLTGLLGVLIVVAGVIALSHPFTLLVYLAILIGIAFVAEGIADVMAGVQGGVRPRWFGFVSGILSILAGIVMFVLPGFGYSVFLLIGSIALIVVSVSTLLTIPRRAKTV
jgi:uncharacterized membrane protein HdeD (DUF308 family)